MKLLNWIKSFFTREDHIEQMVKRDLVGFQNPSVRQYMDAEPHICDTKFWIPHKDQASDSQFEDRYTCAVCGNWEFRKSLN